MQYLKNSKIINYSSINLENLKPNSPLIFSSFHFGSFRLFNSVLFELGHKIVIIIDDTIVQKQKDDLLYKVKPLLNAKKSSDFLILSVQDRTSIFKLKKLISEGYIMSVYLDGNNGVNIKKQNFEKGFNKINFLNKEIFVKNGIPKLASLLKAKIIPVLSYRNKNEDSIIEFHKELYATQYQTKQEFIIKSIEKSFSLLEKKIKKHPSQFTSWLTLQDMFLRNYSSSYIKKNIIKGIFNDSRYSIFLLNTSYFIFDLLDYKSYPINQKLANSIKKNNFDNIDLNLKQELIQKNIII